MSEQQQVSDEGARPGKSHNGVLESKLNLTLFEKGRDKRQKTRSEQNKCSERRGNDSKGLTKHCESQSSEDFPI